MFDLEEQKFHGNESFFSVDFSLPGTKSPNTAAGTTELSFKLGMQEPSAEDNLTRLFAAAE